MCSVRTGMAPQVADKSTIEEIGGEVSPPALREGAVDVYPARRARVL
jgi:hypothetical protein